LPSGHSGPPAPMVRDNERTHSIVREHIL